MQDTAPCLFCYVTRCPASAGAFTAGECGPDWAFPPPALTFAMARTLSVDRPSRATVCATDPDTAALPDCPVRSRVPARAMAGIMEGVRRGWMDFYIRDDDGEQRAAGFDPFVADRDASVAARNFPPVRFPDGQRSRDRQLYFGWSYSISTRNYQRRHIMPTQQMC